MAKLRTSDHQRSLSNQSEGCQFPEACVIRENQEGWFLFPMPFIHSHLLVPDAYSAGCGVQMKPVKAQPSRTSQPYSSHSRVDMGISRDGHAAVLGVQKYARAFGRKGVMCWSKEQAGPQTVFMPS